ncbi:MAG: translesion error-prone DNA polymerase V autoproteolytic subunit [Flavisolibacter sp.]
MDTNFFCEPSYKGSKEFSQHDIPSANATGFGSAADDYTERGIDLNEQLIKNKPATFFMRVNSEAMIGAGINRGDMVIVDRSILPRNGKVVIGVVNGEMMIRLYEVFQKKIRLSPASKALSVLDIDPSSDFYVWGVVTYVIHSV